MPRIAPSRFRWHAHSAPGGSGLWRAIPLDRLIVAAGERPGILWLPPGRYRFVARDGSGVECGRIEQPVPR